MNTKPWFVSPFSLPLFLDFKDRYSNQMEGCVEPLHSRDFS